MEMMLSIPRDFNPSPAGRTTKDGPFNGETFRQRHLLPALREALRTGGRVVVDFDGADSYSSSFLEEAFGGLVRSGEFSGEELDKIIELHSQDPTYEAYVADAQAYLNEAIKAAKKARH